MKACGKVAEEYIWPETSWSRMEPNVWRKITRTEERTIECGYVFILQDLEEDAYPNCVYVDDLLVTSTNVKLVTNCSKKQKLLTSKTLL